MEHKDRRVLITGGSGFIGTNLVELSKAQGCELLNFDKKPPQNLAHSGLWREIDLMDRAQLENAVREFDPDYIFHLAARTDLDGKTVEDYAENFSGTQNLVDAVSALGRLKRIVFASTRLIFRIGYQPKNDTDYCPTTPYGESKILVEKLLRKSTRIPCSWTMVRPTSIWGPWFGIPYKTFFLPSPRAITSIRARPGFASRSALSATPSFNCSGLAWRRMRACMAAHSTWRTTIRLMCAKWPI